MVLLTDIQLFCPILEAGFYLGCCRFFSLFVFFFFPVNILLLNLGPFQLLLWLLHVNKLADR